MPTYEYQCEACGVFEKYQNMSEEAMKTCPTCGKPVNRLIGAGAGMIFKGSGFYQTDYKKTSAPAASKCESCPSAGGCSGGGD